MSAPCSPVPPVTWKAVPDAVEPVLASADVTLIGPPSWPTTGAVIMCATTRAPARAAVRVSARASGSSGTASPRPSPSSRTGAFSSAAITSSALRTSVAPSRIRALQPEARASIGWPGTAMTSRP